MLSYRRVDGLHENDRVAADVPLADMPAQPDRAAATRARFGGPRHARLELGSVQAPQGGAAAGLGGLGQLDRPPRPRAIVERDKDLLDILQDLVDTRPGES